VDRFRTGANSNGVSELGTLTHLASLLG